VTTDHPEVKKVEEEVTARINTLVNSKGKKTVDEFHRELGLVILDEAGFVSLLASGQVGPPTDSVEDAPTS